MIEVVDMTETTVEAGTWHFVTPQSIAKRQAVCGVFLGPGVLGHWDPRKIRCPRCIAVMSVRRDVKGGVQ